MKKLIIKIENDSKQLKGIVHETDDAMRIPFSCTVTDTSIKINQDTVFTASVTKDDKVIYQISATVNGQIAT